MGRLGSVQRNVLHYLHVNNGWHPFAPWVLNSRDETARILNTLVKRGLVSKDDSHQYALTERGRAEVGAPRSYRWVHVGSSDRIGIVAEVGLTARSSQYPDVDLVFSSVAEMRELANTLIGIANAEDRKTACAKSSKSPRHARR